MVNTERMVSQDSGKRPRRVWVWVVAVAALLVVVPLITFGRSAIEGYAQNKVVEQARQHGIILHLTTVDVSTSAVRLARAQFELAGVSGLSATFQSADIAMERLSAKRLKVEGLQVQSVGDPLPLMRAIDGWRAKYATPDKLKALPQLETRGTQFTWRAFAQGPAFVQVDDLGFANSAGAKGDSDWAITGSRAQVGAYVLQPLALALQVQDNAVEVGFGTTQMAAATVRAGWQHASGANDFHVAFDALQVGSLLERLRLPNADPQLAKVSCRGEVSVRVPEDALRPYTGQLRIELQGWVPPHPPELDGFAFGKATQLQSKFEIDRGLSNVKLPEITLVSGALRLSGRGLIQIVAFAYAQLKAELSGQIPCAALASAIAASKLGQAYGRWVAKNAQTAVAGHVDIGVHVDADSRHLGQAKVIKQIGVGCGLRPLALREALSLGLPPVPDVDSFKHAMQNQPTF
jgi:ADP-dependent NAD(P)H-hydrate dehydratase / NAD(P)H-hydrate epimerase